MAEPSGEVVQDAGDMVGPAGMRILLCDPRLRRIKFSGRWSEGDAIRKVRASVTKREQLRLEEVRPTECGNRERRALENGDQAAFPVLWKYIDELGWTVVEPVVCELTAQRSLP